MVSKCETASASGLDAKGRVVVFCPSRVEEKLPLNPETARVTAQLLLQEALKMKGPAQDAMLEKAAELVALAEVKPSA